MKRKLSSLAESAVLVLALLIPAAAIGAPPGPQPKPAAAVPAPHPEIRDAITALQTARQHLNEASHDFGGHRADAVRAINEALKQLQICMRYDK